MRTVHPQNMHTARLSFLFCCGYVAVVLSVSSKVASLALWQANDFPGAWRIPANIFHEATRIYHTTATKRKHNKIYMYKKHWSLKLLLNRFRSSSLCKCYRWKYIVLRMMCDDNMVHLQLPDADSNIGTISQGYIRYCRKLRMTLRWRHNERDSVWNHQPHDCLFNRLFRLRSRKTSKLRDRWIPA